MPLTAIVTLNFFGNNYRSFAENFKEELQKTLLENCQDPCRLPARSDPPRQPSFRYGH